MRAVRESRLADLSRAFAVCHIKRLSLTVRVFLNLKFMAFGWVAM